MPIEKVNLTGFRFGKKGKIYYGPGARKKAAKQGAAIKISEQRKSGENIPVKADNKKRGTIRRF